MQIKRLKLFIIIGATLTLIIVYAIAFVTYQNNKKQEDAANKATKTKTFIDNSINTQPAGLDYQNGFYINYLDVPGVFVIHVTSNPFEGNITAALNYLKSQGVDVSNIKYTCAAVRGVDVTPDELNHCGNTILRN